jgi:hypothetical protein
MSAQALLYLEKRAVSGIFGSMLSARCEADNYTNWLQ